jgi:hypothetical protein
MPARGSIHINDAAANLMSAGGGIKFEASTYPRAISHKLMVDLSCASSSLEGNTYSYQVAVSQHPTPSNPR